MPNSPRHILFDLDGTLTRSDAGIIACIEYALEKMEHTSPGKQALLGSVGPPLEASFLKICGLPEERVGEAIAHYRERYAETGIFENEVYDGIPRLLEALVKKGHLLYVATSKPEVYAKQILEHFGLARHFALVHGSALESRDQTKARIIEEVLADGRIPLGDTVMVGDRHHDIDGARENHIPTIGVLYGYGSRAELEGAGADRIALDVPELGRLLGAWEDGNG